jgi:PAS domain S-box-containing protein
MIVPYLIAVAEYTNDAIIGNDLSGIIQVWNSAAERLFGYSASEATGLPMSILTVPRHSEELQLLNDCVKRDNAVRYCKAIFRGKNGDELSVFLTLIPVKDNAGRVTGSAAIVRAIDTCSSVTAEGTDSQKEMSQADTDSRRLADYARQIVDSLPSPALILQTDGCIRHINSALEVLFGYDRSELLGHQLSLLVPQYVNDYCSEPSKNLSGDQKACRSSQQKPLTGIRKDREEFTVQLSLNIFDGLDHPFVLAHITTMTETEQAANGPAPVKLQTELRCKDLETMLHVTSHDLREPLRSIKMFSQIVFERYAEQLDDRGKDYLRRVRKGAEHLDRLLLDIVSVTQAGRITGGVHWTDGKAIVAEAMRSLNMRINETNARVHIADNLPSLRVSLTWGSLAIQNLIANALKFVRGDVSPEIEVMAYSDENTSGNGIMVRDRGIGVPASHRERIFDLFQRCVGREIEGTGAGLAIVRQIAERHGGRAWVQDRPGGGSDFVVTFGRENPDA